MTKKFCTAAAVFVLLTLTAPARAASITEYINLDFGNGYTVIGNITFYDVPNYLGHPFFPCVGCRDVPPPANLYLNGSPLAAYDGRFGDIWGLGNPTGEPLYWLTPNGDSVDGLTSSLGHLPTTFADFFLNDSPAVSGDVSVVPLPAALPLSGTAILGLAGLAWRRRKVS
jgi:hypothetical protein